MDLLILPHQLFTLDKKMIRRERVRRIVLWEHPQYFKKYKYNKRRLVMHRASMKVRMEELQGEFLGKVEYCDYDAVPKLSKKYLVYDPVDDIKLPAGGVLMESPNFLMSRELMATYRKKTPHFIFGNFYMWSKKELGILVGMKSTDKDNRKKLPKGVKVPKPWPRLDCREEMVKAAKYVEKRFSGNYGTVVSGGEKGEWMPPLCRSDALKLMRYFIRVKFAKFGDYQDAISKDNGFLFHSLLSASINIGLLNPDEVVTAVLKAGKGKGKSGDIPKNSLEGFVRQLFWREYQRYCYIYARKELEGEGKGGDFFGNKEQLGKDWYIGGIGVPVVDDCVKRAFATGYLHHIERLMVIGNFMNLSGIRAKEGFKWFMEFSLDSYEWVMYQNVFDMVFFVTGGLTMRRPYVSSSNYILKMSNYGKGDGKWVEKWDKMYAAFVKRHAKKLHKFRYYFPMLTSKKS